jgi:hypothetical protein
MEAISRWSVSVVSSQQLQISAFRRVSHEALVSLLVLLRPVNESETNFDAAVAL